MDIVVCHNCIDFDTMASMIATKKIYPEVHMVFSGAIDKNVRELLSLHRDLISIISLKDIDPKEVKKLIIVDTRLPERLGPIKKFLEYSHIEIHIYDHHPCRQEDIVGTVNMVREVGATATILVEILKEKHVSILPVEATLFALGIYQDTGSLTFASTTPLDVEMVSFLLSKGAKLDVVARYINRPLSKDQRELLNNLIISSQTYTFEGFEIVITTSEVDRYIEELALISYKMIELERKDAFFSIVRMKDKIYIVARSSVKAIDVSLIARAFGGGGHSGASSATVKESDINKIKERVLELLRKHIKPALTAQDIMSFPVKTIESNLKVGDALKIMRDHGHSGLVIENNGQVCGIISSKELKKAAEHNLMHAPVKAYMTREFIATAPDTPVSKLQEFIGEKQVSRIPIISEKKLVGIVTRTDIIRTIHGDSLYTPHQFPASIEHIAQLPALIQNFLRKAGKVGDQEKMPVYAVGGFVRDLILDQENLDLDLVVEGDGIYYAKKLAEYIGGDVRVHDKFGTAGILFPGDFKIDIASARSEFYTQPGALPKIRYASIKQDLYRRDFTINALALGLNSDNFGQIIDFFRGKRDLESGLIRVLHNLSFIDDPTRIFRAIKFEQRYYFTIEPHTERLIKEATINEKVFEKITIERFVDELIMVLSEERPIAYIKRMAELGILSEINKDIKIHKQITNALDEAYILIRELNKVIDQELHPWLIYFLIITKDLHPDEVRNLAKKLKFKSEIVQKLTFNNNKCVNFSSPMDIPPSVINRELSNLSPEFLIFTLSQSDNCLIRERVINYLTKWRYVKSPLSGRDLIKIGYKPGPLFSKTISLIRDELLDGLIKKEDVLERARELMENKLLKR